MRRAGRRQRRLPIVEVALSLLYHQAYVPCCEASFASLSLFRMRFRGIFVRRQCQTHRCSVSYVKKFRHRKTRSPRAILPKNNNDDRIRIMVHPRQGLALQAQGYQPDPSSMPAPLASRPPTQVTAPTRR